MTAAHIIIQSIPIFAVAALTAIAFTGALKGDSAVACRAQHGAEANTIVCHMRHAEGYANWPPSHACAPGMDDKVCEDAILQNKQALRRLP